MARDIQIVMRDYFESHASSMPALSRVIEQEIILSLLWQRCFMSLHYYCCVAKKNQGHQTHQTRG
jgi:hypothetical protein